MATQPVTQQLSLTVCNAIQMCLATSRQFLYVTLEKHKSNSSDMDFVKNVPTRANGLFSLGGGKKDLLFSLNSAAFSNSTVALGYFRAFPSEPFLKTKKSLLEMLFEEWQGIEPTPFNICIRKQGQKESCSLVMVTQATLMSPIALKMEDTLHNILLSIWIVNINTHAGRLLTSLDLIYKSWLNLQDMHETLSGSLAYTPEQQFLCYLYEYVHVCGLCAQFCTLCIFPKNNVWRK